MSEFDYLSWCVFMVSALDNVLDPDPNYKSLVLIYELYLPFAYWTPTVVLYVYALKRI